MFPVTIEVSGRDEPIDAIKVAFGQHGEKVLAHIVTPDGRIATVDEKDILVYWENTPTKETLAHIDRMVEEGNNLWQETACQNTQDPRQTDDSIKNGNSNSRSRAHKTRTA